MPKRQLAKLLGSFAPMGTELACFIESVPLTKYMLRRKQALLLPKMEPEAAYHCYTGACKMFWKDHNNEEMIFGFCLAGQLLVWGEAFFLSLKNEEIYIEALGDSEVYGISKTQLQEMQKLYPESVTMIDAVKAEMQANWQKHVRILMTHDGLRYARFCEYFPELVKLSLSEKDLCSFLSISRSTLGRARR